MFHYVHSYLTRFVSQRVCQWVRGISLTSGWSDNSLLYSYTCTHSHSPVCQGRYLKESFWPGNVSNSWPPNGTALVSLTGLLTWLCVQPRHFICQNCFGTQIHWHEPWEVIIQHWRFCLLCTFCSLGKSCWVLQLWQYVSSQGTKVN